MTETLLGGGSREWMKGFVPIGLFECGEIG